MSDNVLCFETQMGSLICAGRKIRENHFRPFVLNLILDVPILASMGRWASQEP